MAGIDVVGVIALSITLFNGCLQGFAILCRAQEYDRHIASVRLMLELEQHKLLTWAEEVGLLSDPPQLNLALTNVALVNAILRKLGELLVDVQTLNFKYGLTIETTAEVIEDVNDDLALCQLQVQSPLEVQKWQAATVRVFQKRTQPWRKLKWVMVDEQHFRKLLEDISRFTAELYHFLEHHKRKVVETKHNTLLRSTIINTTSQLALEVIGRDPHVASASSAVAATARFKKKRLRLGILDRFRRTNSDGSVADDASDAQPLISRQTSFTSSLNGSAMESRKLSSRLLTLAQIPQPSEFRQLAYYECQPVLIEWRPILPSTWARTKDRVERLSSLLAELDASSFHSLPCRGYVLNREAGRYGFVFELSTADPYKLSSSSVPSRQGHELPALPIMKTLRTLLGQQPVPSLNMRMRYAIILLETLLQLHTAGWLHKEIRPDNIVSLHHPQCQPHALGISGSVYVAGYAYARPDDVSALTEPSQDSVEAQLYRHPLSLGLNREPYCKSFDLFSVGCMLLEVGLWSNLSTILTNLVDVASGSHTQDNQIQSTPSSITPAIIPSARPQPVSTTLSLPTRSPRRSEDDSGPNLMFRRRVLLRELEAPFSSSNSSFSSAHLHAKSCFPGFDANDRSHNYIDDRYGDYSSIGSNSGQGPVLEALQAQTGQKYTQIVLDCLNAFLSTQELTIKGKQMTKGLHMTMEDRFVLSLEERSLQVLKGLAEAL